MLSAFSSLHILVIDDDEDDFFITSDYINQIESTKLIVDWCYQYTEAMKHLSAHHYDIYFVDYRLGARTGIDLLKNAKEKGIEEPIVLLTGKGNKAVAIEAMQIGATDYLIKTELTTEKLERCIRHSLERSNYLKALRANERKYRNIFERSKDAVFVMADTLHFKDVNRAAANLLGYAYEELQDLQITDLIVDQKIKEALCRDLTAGRDINDLEVELHTREGEKRICILSLSKQVDNLGKSYIQGIFHDITNLKKVEKANLLTEKMAATGRLVRTLAHEVRNPLNNINMSIEQLMQDNQNEEILFYLDIIQRNSYRIGDLIKELINSSHPSELNFTRAALQTILDESIAAAIDRITLQRINMEIRYDNEPAWVMADKEKLRIAFLNIIINAIEAMQDRQGKLTICVQSDKTLHTVIIQDNGCGISKENISRLFEPYFTSKRNGLGLGLASTLNILQSHKAFVDVHSELNDGSAFMISFPTV